jgi:flagellar basal-body rod modification protein FlgD
MQIGTAPVAGTAGLTPRKDANSLGQADFLRLMTEQLKNQDPLKPLESNQFLAQLAQFSTVQGIQGLQATFTALADSLHGDQSLQAAGLIGREALVATEAFALGAEGGIHGAVDAPMAGMVTIEISDAGGQVVRRLSYDTAIPGPVQFEWDRITATGEVAPAGEYTIAARISSGGQAEALRPHIAARVNSVYVTPQGLVLDLAGIGSVPFSAVRRIGG